MATKAARGTKRTCQSDECGSRFYDLNRDPIVCPICGSIYAIASNPAAAAAAAEAEAKAARKPKKVEVVEPEPGELPAVEGEEALADIEAEEPVADAEDATFLEEEEDGGDVTGIIGGVEGGEEET